MKTVNEILTKRKNSKKEDGVFQKHFDEVVLKTLKEVYSGQDINSVVNNLKKTEEGCSLIVSAGNKIQGAIDMGYIGYFWDSEMDEVRQDIKNTLFFEDSAPKKPVLNPNVVRADSIPTLQEVVKESISKAGRRVMEEGMEIADEFIIQDFSRKNYGKILTQRIQTEIDYKSSDKISENKANSPFTIGNTEKRRYGSALAEKESSNIIDYVRSENLKENKADSPFVVGDEYGMAKPIASRESGGYSEDMLVDVGPLKKSPKRRNQIH